MWSMMSLVKTVVLTLRFLLAGIKNIFEIPRSEYKYVDFPGKMMYSLLHTKSKHSVHHDLLHWDPWPLHYDPWPLHCDPWTLHWPITFTLCSMIITLHHPNKPEYNIYLKAFHYKPENEQLKCNIPFIQTR
jgi:hypothetical protein